MRQVDRADFAPADALENIYEDEPIKNREQPDLLAAEHGGGHVHVPGPSPGQKVLEIGTGSGYSAAVTAQLISPGGILYSMEIVSELHEFAAKNLQSPKYLQFHYELIEGDGSEGLAEHARMTGYTLRRRRQIFRRAAASETVAVGGIFLYPEAFGSLFL